MFEEKIEFLNQQTSERTAGYTLPQQDKRVYTVEEIQNILCISRTTAYELVKKGLFHCVKVGGSIRISKRSFDEWLDKQL